MFGMVRMYESLSEDARREFLTAIGTALLWKGWDEKCSCHACESVRKIAVLLEKHGFQLEEFT